MTTYHGSRYMILILTILALSTLKDFMIGACIEKLDTTKLYTLGLHNPVDGSHRGGDISGSTE